MLKLFPNPILFSWYKVNKITSIIEGSIINYYDAVIRDHFFSIRCPNIFYKNSFLALVSICIRFWVRLSVILIPVSFNFFFLFLNTIPDVIAGKHSENRHWMFAIFTFSCQMTLIYISICKRFLQKLVQGFRHNNIGINFLYTMY